MLHLQNNLAISSKADIHTLRPSNSTSRYLLWKKPQTCAQEDMKKVVPYSHVYNTFSRETDKLCFIHTMEAYIVVKRNKLGFHEILVSIPNSENRMLSKKIQLEKGYIQHNFWQQWSKDAGKLSFPKPTMKLDKLAKDNHFTALEISQTQKQTEKHLYMKNC